jgi:hypothetical protein
VRGSELECRATPTPSIGESTPQNPSGNSYLAYRDMEAKDFTAKFEIKIEGRGGSGFQYRSKTGLPWLANIPANVTANVGPVNLNWMMTGPQADFWPSDDRSVLDAPEFRIAIPASETDAVEDRHITFVVLKVQRIRLSEEAAASSALGIALRARWRRFRIFFAGAIRSSSWFLAGAISFGALVCILSSRCSDDDRCGHKSHANARVILHIAQPVDFATRDSGRI